MTVCIYLGCWRRWHSVFSASHGSWGWHCVGDDCTLMYCIIELIKFKHWCIISLFCNWGVACMDVHASEHWTDWKSRIA